MEQARTLYTDVFGRMPKSVELLVGAGSNRRYARFVHPDGGSVIAVESNNVPENRAFLYLAEHFASKGLPVPRIYAIDDAETAYLQSDLGQTALYDALSEGREQGGKFSTKEVELLEKTLQLLPKVQILGAEDLQESLLLSPTRFDRRSVMFDLNYFKYCFLRPTDTPYDECHLEDDFERLAETLCGIAVRNEGFMYRDFQARNVMLQDGLPYLIDFQGGRRGPLQYDVASFLGQASARYPEELRDHLIEVYLDALSGLKSVDRSLFAEELQLFFLFRLLQVLGAYGLRGLYERKPYFLESIPPALEQLKRQLNTAIPYPELHRTLERLTHFRL